MPPVSKQSPKPKPKTTAVSSAVTGIESEIGDIDTTDEVKASIYGRSGTGKTTFCATFPGPILWLVCSGGKRPGELKSVDTPDNRKKIKKINITKPNQINEAADYQAYSDRFKTIVLDHATGLQDLTLAELLGLEELPAQGSWGMAKQQDWQQCALQMKERLRLLLSLSCNVLIISQEREFKNDGDESEVITPYVSSALTPSVSGWLSPACDFVVQTFIRPKLVTKQVKVGTKTISKQERVPGYEFCMRTGPHDVFATKFRMPRTHSSMLPEVIVDPNYDKFIRLSKGEKV